MKLFTKFFRDASPFLALHGFVLLATCLVSAAGFCRADSLGVAMRCDFLVQFTFAAWLMPCWLFSGNLSGGRGPFLVRYATSVTIAIAGHGVIAGVMTLLGCGAAVYAALWSALAMTLAVLRMRRLWTTSSNGRCTISSSECFLVGALVSFCVATYQVPRSNDVRQFELQQTDMLVEDNLRPSPIGMRAMGVDAAMPRWRANSWHQLPCVISRVSGVPVDLVLFRFGTIPLAVMVLVSLWGHVVALGKCRRSSWLALFIVIGPVLLWYRSYNAFNYSFRLTNSFWLDKDIALFCLIPMCLYRASEWLRGVGHRNARDHAAFLIALIPAVLKFHPMTAVYLVLLVPVVLIWKSPPSRAGLIRAGILAFGACVLFVSVLLIGDAQSYHEEIRRIVTMDHADHLTGRPLHYWPGLYGAIADTGLEMDTTQWSDGLFHLKMRVITQCGLLAVVHFVLALSALGLFLRPKRSRSFARAWLATATTVTLLWLIYFGSGFVLTRAPHLSGGVERLHWFAYTPALALTTSLLYRSHRVFAKLLGKYNECRVGRAGSIGLGTLLITAGVFFLLGLPSPLVAVRGVNSLLDFELPYQLERNAAIGSREIDAKGDYRRPEFLREDDVVLLLEIKGKDTYWWIKQGVFWSDSYAEAFAMHRRGESFVNDRRHFYALVDRVPLKSTASWIREKSITLLVDRREGADEYLAGIVEEFGLDATRIGQGVWRLARP